MGMNHWGLSRGAPAPKTERGKEGGREKQEWKGQAWSVITAGGMKGGGRDEWKGGESRKVRQRKWKGECQGQERRQRRQEKGKERQKRGQILRAFAKAYGSQIPGKLQRGPPSCMLCLP